MKKKNELTQIETKRKKPAESILTDNSEKVINKVREIFGSDVKIEKILHKA